MPISETTLKGLIEKSQLVPKSDLKQAQTTSQHLGCSIADVLLGRDLLNEDGLGKLLAKHYQTKFVNLQVTKIPAKILHLIPESIAADASIIAFDKKGSQLYIAMEDPKDLDAIELVRKTLGGKVKLVSFVTTPSGIKEALKLYKISQRKDGDETTELAKPNTTSAVLIIDQLLDDAVGEEASDIHIEPLATTILVRFRIDGVLHDRMALPIDLKSSLSARVKILAELKIDEDRLPQDGRFPFETKRGDKVSLRVSIVPTAHGEKTVLRILTDTLTKFNLEDLGLLPEDQEVIRKTLEKSSGMCLVTGPTGSGKTTSLYSLLGMLNKPGTNILTIEDPIENRVRRINQMQVNNTIGLTFANGLRSILRQDPDVIMVGEIRDKETAVISVNAAMTGHFVFSTVHANTAASVIPRMIDLGIEPFLLASTLNIVVAQRLVRMVCSFCAQDAPLSPTITKKLSDTGSLVSSSVLNALKLNIDSPGCARCNFTGFRGRTGVFELLLVDDNIRDLIIAKKPSRIIQDTSLKQGSKSMLEDGLIKVTKKITTIEEVFRVAL